MTHELTCAAFADRLADLLEREVEESERAAMEGHAVACAECGPLLADLRTLRIDAANLSELVPSRDLWNGVAARIATPVIELQGRGPRGDAYVAGRTKRRIATGLAAAGLVIVTAGITYEITKRTVSGAEASRAAAPAPVATTPPDTVTAPTRLAVAPSRLPSIDSTKTSAAPSATMRQVSSPAPASPETAAQATYDREITRLRTVLQQRRSRLDPQTVTVIELNLRVIDEAIAQCRQALLKDPASRFLMQSLNDELENKIELLRRAALLPLRSS